MFFIYALVDPRFALPFYIGKGKGNRPKDHLRKMRKRGDNYRKCARIKEILACGLEVGIEIVFQTEVEEDAYKGERWLIQRFGRIGFDDGGFLTNLTEGGLGGPAIKGKPKSAETRAKMSDYAKKRSPEHREALSKAHTGLKKPGKASARAGKTYEEIHGVEKALLIKERIGAGNAGRVVTDETRAKISEANKVALASHKPVFTEEMIARRAATQSVQRKGKPIQQSELFRQKRNSPESIAKRAATLRARNAARKAQSSPPENDER